MSNLTQYHLVYVNENWTLKRAGAERATEIFYGKTKEEAIRLCSQRLQNSGSSLRIHNKNGQIEEERTYPRSADPRDYPWLILKLACTPKVDPVVMRV